MSDVIESYIRRHPDLSFQDSMDSFLKEERIQDWVGGDLNRRERLEREFLRVWIALNPSGSHTAPAQQAQPPPKPAQAPAPPKAAPPPPPARPKTQAVVVEPVAKPAPAPAPAPPQAVRSAQRVDGSRQLQVLCTVCRKFAVYSHGTTVSCARCGTNHDDMLGLIPAKAVGPFAFLFGEGWQGVATFVALILLFVLVYGVLRWF